VRTRFSFWAYGILAVAAFAMFLYVITSLSGFENIGLPLLWLAVLIVVSFIFYMFAKLFIGRYR